MDKSKLTTEIAKELVVCEITVKDLRNNEEI